MSSFREKRDVQDGVNDAIDDIKGRLGVGDKCGVSPVPIKNCNAVSYCSCPDAIASVCTCALSWWFILIIVVGVLAIIAGVVCCVKKALCCCCQ